MKGTEKQVAWAEKIKAKHIADLEKGLKVYKESRHLRLAAFLEKVEEEVLHQDNASWWIENRGSIPVALGAIGVTMQRLARKFGIKGAGEVVLKSTPGIPLEEKYFHLEGMQEKIDATSAAVLLQMLTEK
jgi:hypothetical protein